MFDVGVCCAGGFVVGCVVLEFCAIFGCSVAFAVVVVCVVY